ncbi:MAG TPA: o-succinylbenzoate--CoA ligase [Bacillales bacterium]|nr:o-succinylbenzoate--CoA ligase [Bacillales bacterium]
MATEKMPNWLAKRAALTPDRIAVISKAEQWTFAGLNERAEASARRFRGLGVNKREYVAFLMQNGLQVVEVIHAMHYVGTVMVPLNIRLTVRELVWQLKDSEAVMLVYDEANVGKAAEITDLLPHLQTVSYEDLQQSPQVETVLETYVDLEDLHTIVYTSGTTGNPKGVMLTYGNHWWSAIGSSLNLGLHEDDRWLACVPLFHVSGLSILMRSVIYGMTAVIHESFDPEEANRSIAEEGVTIMSVVSAMLSRMLESLGPDRYPSHFRCMLLGGGPAPQVLLEKCKEREIPVFQTYGMSETASQIVTLAPENMLDKLGSAGKALFPAELKIEQNGEPAAVGEVGEIIVRGPNVTKGYLKRDDETEKAIRGDWLYSGDLGYVDDEGFLFVLDRRKDLIISGGENVYPAEVEAVLLAHPDVEDAGVTGISDERWGEMPIAFVKVKNGCGFDEGALISFCGDHLARYKVPSRVYQADELPRNASKKLLRRKLAGLIRKQ